MKLIIYIYLLFLQVPFLLSQPGNQVLYFSIDFFKECDQNITPYDFANSYDIKTYIFTDSLQFPEKTYNANDLFYQVPEGAFLYPDGPFSQKNKNAENVFERRYSGCLIIRVTDYDIQSISPFETVNLGAVLLLQLKNKKNKKSMNIFIRLPKIAYFGIDNEINIKCLNFIEGNYFYDLLPQKYKPDYYIKDLNSYGLSFHFIPKPHEISIDEINQILKNTSAPYFKILTQSAYLKENILSTYKIEVINQSVSTLYNSENQQIVDHIKKQSVFSILFPIPTSDNLTNETILSLTFTDIISAKEMKIFFKVYKTNEDFNKNEITITNFHFKEGFYYYNMKTYKKNTCQSEPIFIDNFDMNNIEDFRITDTEMKELIK